MTFLRVTSLGCLALAITACTSVTQEKVNSTPSSASISPVLAQQQTHTLKRKVAIARFSDETKRSNSFLLNNDGSKVGKQATDILASRLTESGKFIMLERSDMDKIVSEQNFANITPQKVGADYLIVGSVSEFGRTNESEVGIFSRNKIQTARATVNIRLIDTATGQIVFSQEGTGEASSEANQVAGVGKRAGYDASLDDKAVSAAISKLTSNLIENLLEKPWKAFLVKSQSGQLMMTGGPSQGVNVGDTFDVLTKGEMITNPQTGLPIELPGKKVATITTTQSIGNGDNELSLCKVTQGSISNFALDKLTIQEQN